MMALSFRCLTVTIGGQANRNPERTMIVGEKKTKNTRERIIDAAKKLFAEQGYQKTTVMDIAREIELSEAALYEYFKGKEDLLLTIPDLWVSELLADMEDQLFGIEDAFGQLRKYIWWTLRRIEQSPLDAKVVYLFLKTNANFLETDVYGNVRSLYAKLIDIFELGKNTGEMDPDLDPYAAREIVVGTIDYVVTRWLLMDMSYPLFEKLDKTYQMFEKAFRPPAATHAGSMAGCHTSGDCES
jgi:TetR/AcrR family transcriptional regulator, fatty acid metabolism regulator protein